MPPPPVGAGRATRQSHRAGGSNRQRSRRNQPRREWIVASKSWRSTQNRRVRIAQQAARNPALIWHGSVESSEHSMTRAGHEFPNELLLNQPGRGGALIGEFYQQYGARRPRGYYAWGHQHEETKT